LRASVPEYSRLVLGLVAYWTKQGSFDLLTWFCALYRRQVSLLHVFDSYRCCKGCKLRIQRVQLKLIDLAKEKVQRLLDHSYIYQYDAAYLPVEHNMSGHNITYRNVVHKCGVIQDALRKRLQQV
jgi:hypothetical protein